MPIRRCSTRNWRAKRAGDHLRCTRALAEAALDDLAWLGLEWEEPVRFQSEHMADYAAALERLRSLGLVYPCACSRQDIARGADPARRDPEGQPLYPGACKRRAPERGPFAWRLDAEKAGGPPEWGDVVLGRRDIGASYHIAVVADDALQGVTDVVRGKDMESATTIHRTLQRLLGLPAPRYVHHDLLTDAAGRKLSKSAGDRSLRSLREAGLSPEAVRASLGFARSGAAERPTE
jgi:glutamyl-Q tRNA(Asp) synthetase